ncbi:DUF4365 domain-containing protein [Halalkalibacter alkaliphilus]|uniref:DUF4365 domain-containing protein n=1 Tax=Halalkalibacter alkaliphilus TaxID=2917993 RepID=A0A9X2CUX1_9BACI|nr:DUF4365 domain-containing protein [Halalkalibacter alkaliphilus]MCL7748766.1 DUF4365 domain-containing protein [Halalkalibacter alkaliphilus]
MEELGSIFREQPTQDYGIDGYMEVVDDEFVTGRLIANTNKSRQQLLKKGKQHFTFRGKIGELLFLKKKYSMKKPHNF